MQHLSRGVEREYDLMAGNIVIICCCKRDLSLITCRWIDMNTSDKRDHTRAMDWVMAALVALMEVGWGRMSKRETSN